MKSRSQDSETNQALSFGEILKGKEKQVQQAPEVSASSAAIAKASGQTLSVAIPTVEISFERANPESGIDSESFEAGTPEVSSEVLVSTADLPQELILDALPIEELQVSTSLRTLVAPAAERDMATPAATGTNTQIMPLMEASLTRSDSPANIPAEVSSTQSIARSERSTERPAQNVPAKGSHPAGKAITRSGNAPDAGLHAESIQVTAAGLPITPTTTPHDIKTANTEQNKSYADLRKPAVQVQQSPSASTFENTADSNISDGRVQKKVIIEAKGGVSQSGPTTTILRSASNVTKSIETPANNIATKVSSPPSEALADVAAQTEVRQAVSQPIKRAEAVPVSPLNEHGSDFHSVRTDTVHKALTASNSVQVPLRSSNVIDREAFNASVLQPSSGTVSIWHNAEGESTRPGTKINTGDPLGVDRVVPVSVSEEDVLTVAEAQASRVSELAGKEIYTKQSAPVVQENQAPVREAVNEHIPAPLNKKDVSVETQANANQVSVAFTNIDDSSFDKVVAPHLEMADSEPETVKGQHTHGTGNILTEWTRDGEANVESYSSSPADNVLPEHKGRQAGLAGEPGKSEEQVDSSPISEWQVETSSLPAQPNPPSDTRIDERQSRSVRIDTGDGEPITRAGASPDSAVYYASTQVSTESENLVEATDVSSEQDILEIARSTGSDNVSRPTASNSGADDKAFLGSKDSPEIDLARDAKSASQQVVVNEQLRAVYPEQIAPKPEVEPKEIEVETKVAPRASTQTSEADDTSRFTLENPVQPERFSSSEISISFTNKKEILTTAIDQGVIATKETDASPHQVGKDMAATAIDQPEVNDEAVTTEMRDQVIVTEDKTFSPRREASTPDAASISAGVGADPHNATQNDQTLQQPAFETEVFNKASVSSPLDNIEAEAVLPGKTVEVTQAEQKTDAILPKVETTHSTQSQPAPEIEASQVAPGLRTEAQSTSVNHAPDSKGAETVVTSTLHTDAQDFTPNVQAADSQTAVEKRSGMSRSEKQTAFSVPTAPGAPPDLLNSNSEKMTVEVKETPRQTDNSLPANKNLPLDLEAPFIPGDVPATAHGPGHDAVKAQATEESMVGEGEDVSHQRVLQSNKSQTATSPSEINAHQTEAAVKQTRSLFENNHIETQPRGVETLAETSQAGSVAPVIVDSDPVVHIEDRGSATKTVAQETSPVTINSDLPAPAHLQVAWKPETTVLDALPLESQVHTPVAFADVIPDDRAGTSRTDSVDQITAGLTTDVNFSEVAPSQTENPVNKPVTDIESNEKQVHVTQAPSKVSHNPAETAETSTSTHTAVEVKPQNSASTGNLRAGFTDTPEAFVVAASSAPSSNTEEPPVSFAADISMNVDAGKEELSAKQIRSTDENAFPVENQQERNDLFEPALVTKNSGKETEVIDSVARKSTGTVDTHAVEVVQQVIHRLNGRLKSGPASMHLQLNPAELGTINIEVIRDAQGINVTFFAEQASTGRLLETQLSQLHQSLVDSGVQLSGLNIGQHNHARQEGGFPNQNTDFAQTSSREASQNPANPKDSQRGERVVGQISEVDYLI